MWSWTSWRLKIWGVRAGLLALALQTLAGAVPMPSAAAGSVAVIADGPAWIGESVCRANGDTPTAAHPVCPVCFVLCQAAGLPPAHAAVALPVTPGQASVPADDSAAPPAAPGPNPARGPPGLA